MEPQDRLPDQVQVTVEDIMHEAVSGAVRERGGEPTAIITHWVALAEYINDNGERGLMRLTSPGLTPWMRDGMWNHGAAMDAAMDEEETE
jgi:hypothetical protein